MKSHLPGRTAHCRIRTARLPSMTRESDARQNRLRPPGQGLRRRGCTRFKTKAAPEDERCAPRRWTRSRVSDTPGGRAIRPETRDATGINKRTRERRTRPREMNEPGIKERTRSKMRDKPHDETAKREPIGKYCETPWRLSRSAFWHPGRANSGKAGSCALRVLCPVLALCLLCVCCGAIA